MSYFKKSIFLGLASIAMTRAVIALPSSPTVIDGDVSFSNPDIATLVVTSNSARSIIDWDSFSSDVGESVFFNLPDSDSVILNRVTSSTSTDFSGIIYSNGTVYLINENGVIFEASSAFLGYGVLLSTLDASNMDFLAAGDMNFSGTSNQTLTFSGGIVTAGGDTTFLGYQIYNEGGITTLGETVALGSGQEIVFHPTGSVRIEVDSQGVQASPIGTGIEFATPATIYARQVEMKADGGFFEYGIDHEGNLTVLGNSTTNGYVIFSAENGTAYLNGFLTNRNLDTTGGNVDAFAQTLILDGSCYIDSSGLIGGGQVNIGSRYQGSGAPFNSINTQLISGAYISTDAGLHNNGGQIVIWSDDVTAFYGTLTARGGTFDGDGALVEVSGVNSLTYSGNVDNGAAHGTDGLILLDPNVLLYQPRRSK